MIPEIEKQRIKAGLLIKDVAKTAKITERAYYYYKSGKRTPSIDIYNRMKRAVGLKKKIVIINNE